VFRTPFGKLKLGSPQLYCCACGTQRPKSVSPLAKRLAERTSPELAYLETQFAALVSCGFSVKLLKEVLAIHQELNTMAIQLQVCSAGRRLGSRMRPSAAGRFR
jgi:hypothetical protein